MKKVPIVAAALAALVAVAATAQAQSPLTTAPPNNGSGGVFMNLTDLTGAGQYLSIGGFDLGGFTGTVGTAVDVEVWTRLGSYVGFEGSSAGWTLTQTIGTIRNGSTTPSPLPLMTDIIVPDSGTMAVYLHAIGPGTGGIRYTGTSSAPPVTTWTNSDMQLFSDVARTGSVPFAGSLFSPRTFSGSVHYGVIPAPASLALLGLAGLVGRRRR